MQFLLQWGCWDLFNFLNTRNMCWLVFGVVSSCREGFWVGELRFHSIFHKVVRPSPASLSPLCHVFYLLYFTYQRIDYSKEAHTRSFGTDDRVSRHETSGNRLIENVTIFAIFSYFFSCWLLRRLPHSFPTLFQKERRMLFSGITWVFSKFDKFFSFLLYSFQHHWQCRVRQHRAIFISIDRNLLPPRRRKVAFQLLLLADFLPI